MTNEERREAAWIVFDYERGMYLDLHDIHARNPDGVFVFGPGASLGRTIINSLTEARVLHANILCEMLTRRVPLTEYLSIWDMLDLFDPDSRKTNIPQEATELSRVYGYYLESGTLSNACHFRVKTPGTCRGDSFDYREILKAIHEPLVAAMDAVIARRKLQEKAAEARIDEDRPVQVKLSPGSEVIWGQGGKIVDLSPKPRFVRLTRFSGSPEFVDAAKVMAVGPYEESADKMRSRVSFSPDGDFWIVVQESPEEVVAKLEGRA